MTRFAQNRIGVEQGDTVLFSDFENDGPMWTADGPREVRVTVSFKESFVSPPAVQAGLSMWDMAHDANGRVDLTCDNMTAEGFTLIFRTWGDSRIARARASWMAIGPVQDEDTWQVD